MKPKSARPDPPRRPGERRPDTGLLYSVDDLARLARVPKVVITRLCHSGEMPPWREIDGRKYWNRARAVEALAHIEMLNRGHAA
jgi:hypothetical protein